MSDHKHEANQEMIEIAQQQAHDDRECEGVPFCAYCLDDWEEKQRQELDDHGYYDWNGKWTT